MSVTFKLKEGVLWSDGEPFTAEDVKFTWEYTTRSRRRRRPRSPPTQPLTTLKSLTT